MMSETKKDSLNKAPSPEKDTTNQEDHKDSNPFPRRDTRDVLQQLDELIDQQDDSQLKELPLWAT